MKDEKAIARLRLMGLCLVDAQMQHHVADAMQGLVEFVREHPEVSGLRGPELLPFRADLYAHVARVTDRFTALLAIHDLHEAGHLALGDDTEHDEQATNLLRSVFPEGEVEL